jgi:hypothetical protein
MSKLGNVTAFAAEAALWVTGAAFIASAAGMHWNVDLTGTDIGGLVGARPSASASAGSSGGAAGPGASLAPGASPTTSPISAKLMAFMSQHSQVRARVWMSISGTAGSVPVKVTMSGSMSSDGDSDTISYRTTANGAVTTKDTVDVGQTSYASDNGGSWTKSARSASSVSSAESPLTPTMRFVDKGVESKYGVELHRLELIDATALTAATLKNLGPPSFQTGEFTLTIWTTDDGTPSVLEEDGSYQGTSDSGPTKGTMVEEFRFIAFSAETITAPI